MENTERRRAPSEQHRNRAYSRYRRSSAAPPKRDIREKILLQIIVSGMLFLMILIINMINIEPLRNFRLLLKTAVAESMTAENLKDDWRDTGKYFTSVQNTVLTIFGEETAQSTNKTVAESAKPKAAELSETDAGGAETGEVEPSEGETSEGRGVDFRLDEELLGIPEEAQTEAGDAEKKR